VGYLVPYCIFQEFLQVETVLGHPLVRALENRNAVRQSEAVVDAPPRQGTAFIESQKAGPGRFALDYKGDIVEATAKSGWDRSDGFLHQFVELLRGHSKTIVGGRNSQDGKTHRGGH
jgi:hypothetical protein